MKAENTVTKFNVVLRKKCSLLFNSGKIFEISLLCEVTFRVVILEARYNAQGY